MYDFREIDKEINSIVNYVNNKYPSSNIYLVGFSFGASMAMKYIALNPNQKVKAVVSVANPWDVYKAAENLNSKKNFLYAKFLT